MALSVVVADDHPVVVAGLQLLLTAEPEFTIAAACTTSDQALAAIRKHRPAVLLIDLRMPGRPPPLDVVQAIESEKLPTRAILLTAAIDEHDMLQAIRAGVRGIILKEMAPRLLIQCIRKVGHGGTWLETESIDRAVKRLAGCPDRTIDWTPLTARERQVLRLVVGGMRNRDIAASLAITLGTVKIHVYNIFRKLQVTSRVELTLYARRRGLS